MDDMVGWNDDWNRRGGQRRTSGLGGEDDPGEDRENLRQWMVESKEGKKKKRDLLIRLTFQRKSDAKAKVPHSHYIAPHQPCRLLGDQTRILLVEATTVWTLSWSSATTMEAQLPPRD